MIEDTGKGRLHHNTNIHIKMIGEFGSIWVYKMNLSCQRSVIERTNEEQTFDFPVAIDYLPW